MHFPLHALVALMLAAPGLVLAQQSSFARNLLARAVRSPAITASNPLSNASSSLRTTSGSPILASSRFYGRQACKDASSYTCPLADYCCPDGQECCNNGQCAPEGADCCNDGMYCSAGYACNAYGTSGCCEIGVDGCQRAVCAAGDSLCPNVAWCCQTGLNCVVYPNETNVYCVNSTSSTTALASSATSLTTTTTSTVYATSESTPTATDETSGSGSSGLSEDGQLNLVVGVALGIPGLVLSFATIIIGYRTWRDGREKRHLRKKGGRYVSLDSPESEKDATDTQDRSLTESLMSPIHRSESPQPTVDTAAQDNREEGIAEPLEVQA